MLSYSKLGAQVLQASINGRQLLYLSPLANDAQQTVRGGIPVLFPQFADRGPFKKHGFARDLPWQLLHESTHTNGQSLVFELQIQQGDQYDWPYSAKLVLTAQLMPKALKMHLQVCNSGSSHFAWTGGLHPYICLADLCASQLLGLHGTAVRDRYDPDRTTETDSAVSWNGDEFERLYDSQSQLRLQTPTHTIQLSMTGFRAGLGNSDRWIKGDSAAL